MTAQTHQPILAETDTLKAIALSLYAEAREIYDSRLYRLNPAPHGSCVYARYLAKYAEARAADKDWNDARDRIAQFSPERPASPASPPTQVTIDAVRAWNETRSNANDCA